MFVYVIVNNATLKLYVGQHKGTNLLNYLQQKFAHAQHHEASGSYLYASMRKHPRECWSIHPILSGLQTREEVDQWERYYIELFHATDPRCGYNICRGGEGRTGPQSEEAKRKISLGLMGRPVSEETRAKIRAANIGKLLGRKASPETVAKMSASMKGKPATFGMLGKTHSEETLKKMQEAAVGRISSPEAREKMSAARKGHSWSESRRAACRPGPSWNKGKSLTEEHKAKLRGPRAKKVEHRLTAVERAKRWREKHPEDSAAAQARSREKRLLKTIAWG